MKQPPLGVRRRKASSLARRVALRVAVFAALALFLLSLRFLDLNDVGILNQNHVRHLDGPKSDVKPINSINATKNCATVEEMGSTFSTYPYDETIRVRRLIHHHFLINGAGRVRALPPEQFCRHGFVMAKASEAGFGNEMYKILNSAALSLLLNRSLIIGQTRHIGKPPFGDYINYSNEMFTLAEVKHLWRSNNCVKRYKRHLVMRIDDFAKPTRTNVLCSNWRKWNQPIIWFQNTTDAVPTQFFLKNIHPEMNIAANQLFGNPEDLQSRPNVFGELMKYLIYPSKEVDQAVKWALNNGSDPHISLHMRMLMNSPVRAMQAAIKCTLRATNSVPPTSRPRVVLVSDTPSVVKALRYEVAKFADVVYFNYKRYEFNASDSGVSDMSFRARDWGPAPRWVAFVDFFLASRATYGVVSGAHRRVGTTYAQLVAALAAANSNRSETDFKFLSSFHNNILVNGLRMQIGWGHLWNRFSGSLSCVGQPNQCTLSPVLPPAWWDGIWQSPIQRDIRRMAEFGVKISGFGNLDQNYLVSYCSSRKTTLNTVLIL